MTIDLPDNIPDDLREVEFFLFKRSDFGSAVSIRNLAMQEKYFYENDRFISRVDISPDGKYLIYNQVFSLDTKLADWLWRVNRKNDQEMKIAGWNNDVTEVVITNPSITHDGEYVLFSVKWISMGREGIARVDINGNSIEILDTTKRLVEGPESSPDNSVILVLCAGYGVEFNHVGLCLLDRDGKFIKYLSDEGDLYGNYYFTPDGQKIVYSEYFLGGLLGIINPEKNYFYVMDLDTDEKRLLLDWDINVLGFSPDGKQIIFQARTNKWSPEKIFVINIDGTNLRHLAYYDDFLEEWYADADWD